MGCQKKLITKKLRINCICFFVSEIRLRFLEFMGIDPKYFDIRHLYSPTERRIMDLKYIELFEKFKINELDGNVPFFNTFRYKYLKFRYRAEFNQYNKSEQINIDVS